MISRCIAFTDQPDSTNRAASQSSSAGFDGAFSARAEVVGVRTRPSPKWCCQIRLTITRAVSGLSGRASHSASSQPAAPVRDPQGRLTRGLQAARNPARHGFAEPLRVAADEDRGRP